jgi:thiol-disulfide isomerase/thioredoxin
MKNIIITRIVLIAAVLFLLFGIFVAQRQNKDVTAVAAEQLEKADTVKKIEAFLASQNEKKTAEWTKMVTQLEELAPAARDKKVRELLPIFQKFEINLINENVKAGEKILTLAKNSEERSLGYNCLIENYVSQSQYIFEELYTSKIKEAGIKESDPEYQSKAMEIIKKLLDENIVPEPQKKLDALIEQMTKEGKYEKLIKDYKIMKISNDIYFQTLKFSLDKFNKLKDEAKIIAKGIASDEISDIFKRILGLAASEDAVAADKQIVEKTTKEITDYINSDEYLTDKELRSQLAAQIQGLAIRLTGVDLNLYGRTIDNTVFNWSSLRDKIVLVKFTASWCGPCKMEIPNMLKAYEKYHSKGLEIVSVFVFEDGPENDAIENVKKVIQDEKIPWIVISETLTKKAGDVAQSTKYSIEGVPTMLLVGKDGKVIATDMRGATLNKKLAEIFDKK